MILAKTVKKSFVLPDYQVYECRRCAVLTTIEHVPNEDFTVH
jgi:hypothetical protein